MGLGTAAYITWLPHSIWQADEGRFLYEAKRILEGDIPYRDFFEFSTPGIMYLMALLFRVFGTDIATATLAMAVLHGGIAMLVFLNCRALGVRHWISAAVALAHPALCFSVWPYVSPHWLSVFLMLGITLLLVRRPLHQSIRWTASLGFSVGILLLVQQHRGVLFAAGICTLIIFNHVVVYRSNARFALLAVDLLFFVGTFVATVGTALLALIAIAGSEFVFDALVVFPFVDYQNFTDSPAWGLGVNNPFYQSTNAYTFPLVLKYAVVSTAGPLAIAFRAWRRGDAPEELRQMITLVVCAAVFAGSTFNYPDVVHLAFIAPFFAILSAATVDRGLSALPGSISGRLGASIAGALCVVFAWMLAANAERRIHELPLVHETAFGRVAIHNNQDFAIVERVQQLYRDSLSRELYCHEACAQVYLMTGTVNPTRYQWLQHGYFREEQYEETIAALEAKRVEYVVAPMSFAHQKNPVDLMAAYLKQHYVLLDGERAQPNQPYASLFQLAIYRRVD